MKDFADACGFGAPRITPKMLKRLKLLARIFRFSEEAVSDMAFAGMTAEMIWVEIVGKYYIEKCAKIG